MIHPYSILMCFTLLISCTIKNSTDKKSVQPPVDSVHPEIYYGFNAWNDLNEAQSISKRTGKPIFLMFSSFSSDSNPESQWNLLQEEPLISFLKNDLIFTVLYTDDKGKISVIDSTSSYQTTIGEWNSALQKSKFSANSIRYYIVLDSSLNHLSNGFYNLDKTTKPVLESTLAQIRNTY